MFKDNQNVTILLGDSGQVLHELLPTIDERITFWLDAHYCGDGAMIGEKWCPLDEEFKAITAHSRKDHTILIDDWRCMDNTHVDFSWNTQVKNSNGSGKLVGFLGKDRCFKLLKAINTNYNISFENGVIEDDVLACQLQN